MTCHALSLHDALPIFGECFDQNVLVPVIYAARPVEPQVARLVTRCPGDSDNVLKPHVTVLRQSRELEDRKSTRLNSSHVATSYADYCLMRSHGITVHC